MSTLVAWVPFLQPMPSPGPWWPLFLLPLSLGIAMVYKAVRTGDLRRYPREVIVMTTQIVNHRFQGLSWNLTLIDGGHWLGVLLVQGIVIGWLS